MEQHAANPTGLPLLGPEVGSGAQQLLLQEAQPLQELLSGRLLLAVRKAASCLTVAQLGRSAPVEVHFVGSPRPQPVMPQEWRGKRE